MSITRSRLDTNRTNRAMPMPSVPKRKRVDLPQFRKKCLHNSNPAPQQQQALRRMVRGGWSVENMLEALRMLDSKEILTIREAARQFNIPESSIRNWMRGKYNKKAGQEPKCLSSEQEIELKKWALDRVATGMGVTKEQFKMKAAKIGEGNAHTLWANGQPGDKWWNLFKKRHPDIALRSTETLDVARARAMNPTTLGCFYTTLQGVYSHFNFDPSHIWNADETGIQAGKVSGLRVIVKKGSRAVHEMVMRNREWVTVLACCNASGSAMPNFYIFKGNRLRANHVVNCEVCAGMSVQPEAWMTSELFMFWLKEHFKTNVPGGVDENNPHLIILDGHGSHVEDHVILLARSLGIHLVILPPHTSHKMQPLDVAVFGPFKQYFRRNRAEYMNDGTLEPNKAQLAGLISKALSTALTPENIRAGFKATGIWPLNPAVIDGFITAASSTTDRPAFSRTSVVLQDLQLEDEEDIDPLLGPHDHEQYLDDAFVPRIQGLEILMNVATADQAGPSTAREHAFPSTTEIMFDASTSKNGLDAFVAPSRLVTSMPETPSNTATLPKNAQVHYITSDGWIKAVQEERARKAEAESIKKQKAEEKKAAQARKRKEKELIEVARKRRKEEKEMQKKAEVEWEAGTRRLRNLLYGMGRRHIPLCQPREFDMVAYEMRKRRFLLLKSKRETNVNGRTN